MLTNGLIRRLFNSKTEGLIKPSYSIVIVSHISSRTEKRNTKEPCLFVYDLHLNPATVVILDQMAHYTSFTNFRVNHFFCNLHWHLKSVIRSIFFELSLFFMIGLLVLESVLLKPWLPDMMPLVYSEVHNIHGHVLDVASKDKKWPAETFVFCGKDCM